jgi:hypothetical protein
MEEQFVNKHVVLTFNVLKILYVHSGKYYCV